MFSAKLTATDELGFQISGAQASIMLANGTLNLGLMPLGPFHGTLSYLGSTAPISGDASVQPQTSVKILSSYPTFDLIALAVAIIVALGILIVRRRRSQVEATMPRSCTWVPPFPAK